MGPKQVLEELFARKKLLERELVRIEREGERLRSQQTALDLKIDQVLHAIASGESLPIDVLPEERTPSRFYLGHFIESDARGTEPLLRAIVENPDEGLAGWARRLYGVDSPETRHRVRARLDFQRRRGRVVKDGQGRWVLRESELALPLPKDEKEPAT